MKHYVGTIITVNKNNEVFHHLVEDKGEILFIGNNLPKEYNDAELVELGNQVLCPSFVDSHQHFASFSLFHSGLNVMDANSNDEIKEMCREYVKNCDDKLLIAFGASPWSVKEHTLLSKKDLDDVCKDRPFFMVKYDGHACVINSVLLKKVQKKVQNLRGYHFESGEMNQEAFFAVSNYITNSISLPHLIKVMKKAVDYEASKGIALVHDVSGVGFPLNLDITMENIFAKKLKNHFGIRVFPQALNVGVAKKRGIKRIGGCFKCALDGCFGSQDAALNAPYLNDPSNSGVLYYSDELIINWCKKANRAGLQIEMHAIGDKAFDQATRCLKAALDDFPRKDHRHGIIHACLPTKEGIKICKEYGIQLPVQSSFIDWKQEPNEYVEQILGKERCKTLNPLKTFVDNEIIISAGSDAPCTDPNPILWMYKAITNGNEALTREDAIRMCTYNGYWTTFDEAKHGSLEVGKYADMVILSDNPLTIDVDKFMSIKVNKLILHGEDYKPLCKK